MSTFAIEHRPALSGKKTPVISRAVAINPLPEGHVLHVMAANMQGASAESLGAVTGWRAEAFRRVSPEQWFVVGDEPLSSTALAEMTQKLKPIADVVDQSHGRVRIVISGPKAAAVLAKGTAADLSLSAFAVNQATTALVGHISAHITRVADDSFELIALRGFAESLWDELSELSREFA